MMYWGNDINGWGMLLMTFSALVFWGVVIGGIVYLIRQVGIWPQPTAGAPQPDPQRILAARYARGEIDDEEYRRRFTALRNGPSAGVTS
jgi:putative membrane protein